MSEQPSDDQRQAELAAQIARAAKREYVVCATCVNIWFDDRASSRQRKAA